VEQVALPVSATSARSGRVFLRRYCHEHLVPAALADDAVLIASELLGNAYLHARSAVRLSVSWQAGTLRVEVADDSAVLPGRVGAGWDATSGRGMLITDALAGRWGARLAGVGKVVWFEVWAGDLRQGGADVGSGGHVG